MNWPPKLKKKLINIQIFNFFLNFVRFLSPFDIFGKKLKNGKRNNNTRNTKNN